MKTIGGYLIFLGLMGVVLFGARATVFPRMPVNDQTVSLSLTQSYVHCYEPNSFNRKLVAELEVEGGAIHGGFVEKSDVQQISQTMAIAPKSLELAALQDSYFTNLVKGKSIANTAGAGELCLVYGPMRLDKPTGSVNVNVTMKAFWRP